MCWDGGYVPYYVIISISVRSHNHEPSIRHACEQTCEHEVESVNRQCIGMCIERRVKLCIVTICVQRNQLLVARALFWREVSSQGRCEACVRAARMGGTA